MVTEFPWWTNAQFALGVGFFGATLLVAGLTAQLRWSDRTGLVAVAAATALYGCGQVAWVVSDGGSAAYAVSSLGYVLPFLFPGRVLRCSR